MGLAMRSLPGNLRVQDIIYVFQVHPRCVEMVAVALIYPVYASKF